MFLDFTYNFLGVVCILICVIFIILWAVFFLFETEFTLHITEEDKHSKQSENYESYIRTIRCITITILVIVCLTAQYFLHLKATIIDSKASIVAYQTYKNQYSDDKIIDTEIEQKYVSALKKLEYYKSLGIYKE